MSLALRLQDMSADDKTRLGLQRMSEDHKKKLQSNVVKLKADLQVGDVLDHLQENDDFFTDDRCERVMAGEIRRDKVGRLLEHLRSGSELTWICFMDALDRTKFGFIRAYLEGNGTDNVDFQASPPANSGQVKITLTDQPNLTVKQPNLTEIHSFYNEHKNEAYPMDKIPRGWVCIINVKNIIGRQPRYGTDIDRDNLERLFKGLHFEVLVYNDDDGLQAEEIRVKLREFAARSDHKEAQCAVLCLMSHGGEGFIFGTDAKKVNIMEIRNYFNNPNCPALMDKPKLLFFQASRTGDQMKSSFSVWECDVKDHTESRTEDCGVYQDDTQPSQPTQGDMLIGFPTLTGYHALRNVRNGSWYMSALVKVFSERAWNTDISNMMIEIRNLLEKNVSPEGHKQCSEEVVLLKKKLYFFPGFFH